MSMDKWSVLSSLRRAVKKVKILMNLNLHRWRLASMIGSSSSKRRLSFNDRPGLRACITDIDTESYDSGSSRGLHRTTSYASEDDIDKRADLFIANFHRQLQFERQVSLELQYCRANSFGSVSPRIDARVDV
ncbi:DUF761 domain-containing protein [Cephalotus follicularis]|uniref:DUF761 domain-containing protein n=1 Tax=Cephalotus follicularis TaxID=3775 RepID=A0A1Q3AVK8_CEPFO|nr:DUF761 domain-containing protein [Cephalotus follicularis]